MKVKDIWMCDACPYSSCSCAEVGYCPVCGKEQCFYGEECINYINCTCSAPCDNIVRE